MYNSDVHLFSGAITAKHMGCHTQVILPSYVISVELVTIEKSGKFDRITGMQSSSGSSRGLEHIANFQVEWVSTVYSTWAGDRVSHRC